jgi:oligoribonuclease
MAGTRLRPRPRLQELERLVLDRRPEIEHWLHYRSVDVSTIKELGKRWYPAALNSRPFKVGTHRALDDIRESIAELRFYRERFFVPVPGAAAPTGSTEAGPADGAQPVA